MIILAKLIFFAAFGYLLQTRLRTLLAYFQQEEYDGGRYVGALRSVRLYDVRASGAILIAVVIINTTSEQVLEEVASPCSCHQEFHGIFKEK